MAVFFRGGNLVKVPLTANLSGPAYGVQVLTARTRLERCLAHQSAENAKFSLINLADANEIASDYLVSLSSHYIELGCKKRLIFCVPALEAVHGELLASLFPVQCRTPTIRSLLADIPLVDQEKLAYHHARTHLVGKIAKQLKGTKADCLIANIKAWQQVSIGLAVSGETVRLALDRLEYADGNNNLDEDKDP